MPDTILTPDPNNLNKGTERGAALLEKSLQRNGAGRSVLVDRDGVLIAGNKTYQKAMELGIPVQIVETDGRTLIAVRRTDIKLGEDEIAQELALADNRVAQEDLDWDAEALYELVAAGDLQADEYFFEDELAELFADLERGTTPGDGDGNPDLDVDDLDMDIEPPLIPVSKEGEVWVCGPHRVICGDATDADTIARLLNGAVVDMVWTDPPYGVAIGDKNKYLDSVGHGVSNRITENLKNDNVDEAALESMLRSSFAVAKAACRPGAVWQVAAPSIDLFLLFGQALKDLGLWRQTIIWVKDRATFAPLGVDYHWQHENIFHGWVPGAQHHQPATRTETTIWYVDRPQRNPDHPTMKPVALVQKALQNHTNARDAVLDMFGGSGTTMIACEAEGRIAYLSELDPKYVDVILTRYHETTGIDPVCEATGETFSSRVANRTV